MTASPLQSEKPHKGGRRGTENCHPPARSYRAPVLPLVSAHGFLTICSGAEPRAVPSRSRQPPARPAHSCSGGHRRAGSEQPHGCRRCSCQRPAALQRAGQESLARLKSAQHRRPLAPVRIRDLVWPSAVGNPTGDGSPGTSPPPRRSEAGRDAYGSSSRPPQEAEEGGAGRQGDGRARSGKGPSPPLQPPLPSSAQSRPPPP